MTDMRQLYQEVILDHNKNPRNYGTIPSSTNHAEGHNPLCGDHIKLSLNIEHDIISNINFEGEGCAICKASSSMMTMAVKGKNKVEVLNLVEEFRHMITGQLDVEHNTNHHLGHLKVFANIKTLPVRVKCAILPWHTLTAALNNQDNVSTE
jgi:nitrogen fixation protein NifU and related proteins